jgi:diaminopimelate epimerase
MMIPFVKMHGLGNDFVILDQRNNPHAFDSQAIRKISDRRFGIGCDQLITLEVSNQNQADIFMKIYNADGNEVGACGNATRCVAFLLKEEDGKTHHTIQTKAGFLSAEALNDTQVTVDLGAPHFQWQDIPLSQEMDTLHMPITFEGLKDPATLSVGNPHLIFFVYDVESIDLVHAGENLTHHPFFPEGTNVEIVEKVDDHTLRMRVYERGVGITHACGTGAAASVVAAKKRGIIQTPAKVILEGGELLVDYQQTVKITGQVTLSFRGSLNPHIFRT